MRETLVSPPATNDRFSSCKPNYREWEFPENLFSSLAVENTSYYGSAALGRCVNFAVTIFTPHRVDATIEQRTYASSNSCIRSNTVEKRWKLLTVLAP
jgi:hypothetical protein